MPLITLGNDNQLVLKIPSKGDLDWSENFKTQFAQKIVEHDHTGVNGKGKQLTGDSLQDGSINRASLMAIDLQDLPNVTDTYSDPNDPNTIQYGNNHVLKYNVATNTWVPGPEGSNVQSISQTAQVQAFASGTVISVSDIDNLSGPNQYVLDFTGQSSFKSIFLLVNLANPTTQKIILPEMESCFIISNVDVDIEGDLINTKILVRREGGFCTTTMGSTAKMEGCHGDFDRLISGAHVGTDLSRFIQSTILADELQTQLTDNNANTLVVDKSEVIVDLLSNSTSLTTSAEYLKLQNKAQMTVKEFDTTFPIDSTRVNLASRCMLISRSDSLDNTTENTIITWNPQRNNWNYLASPSGPSKLIQTDSSGNFTEYTLSNGHVLKGGSSGFTSEEFKLVNLDDVNTSTANTSSNTTTPLVIDPSDNIVKAGEYLDVTSVSANTLNFTSGSVSGGWSSGGFGIKTDSDSTYYYAWLGWLVNSTTSNSDKNFEFSKRISGSASGQVYMDSRIHSATWHHENDFRGNTVFSTGYNHTFGGTANFNSVANFNYTAGSFSAVFDDNIQVNGVTVTSDYRLKDNVTSLQNASALLMQLNPCRYTWKEKGKEDIGFIAHEVQEVLPEIVYGEKDAVKEDGSIEKQGIDYSKLTSLLTASLQEALVKIDSLEARIKELEDKE